MEQNLHREKSLNFGFQNFVLHVCALCVHCVFMCMHSVCAHWVCMCVHCVFTCMHWVCMCMHSVCALCVHVYALCVCMYVHSVCACTRVWCVSMCCYGFYGVAGDLDSGPHVWAAGTSLSRNQGLMGLRLPLGAS